MLLLFLSKLQIEATSIHLMPTFRAKYPSANARGRSSTDFTEMICINEWLARCSGSSGHLLFALNSQASVSIDMVMSARPTPGCMAARICSLTAAPLFFAGGKVHVVAAPAFHNL